jgi:hypothetical protein
MAVKAINCGKGTIIRTSESVYIPFDGGLWRDHFVDKKLLWVMSDTPDNNGNVIVKRPGKVSRWINVIKTNVEVVKER